MPVFNNILAGAAGQTGGDAAAAGTRSLRFNDDDSAYLNRTPSSASNRKTWTWSAWVKRSTLGLHQYLFSAGSSSNYFALSFDQNDKFQVDSYGSGANPFYMHTGDMVFRDTSAWYHLVAVLDTTESTGTDRFKLYVNGSRVTLTVGTNVPPSNADQLVNSTTEHRIGRISYGSYTNYFNGYLADVHFIDGQVLAPTNFGESDTNGVWQRKTFTGSHSTGTVYSSYGATTNVNTSYPWTLAFDGNATGSYSNGAGAADGGNWARWTPPANSINIGSALRINTDNGSTSAVKVKIGSTVHHLTSLSDGWNNVSGTGNLEYIEISNSGSTWSYLCAVEVDGTVLTDGTGANSFALDFSDSSNVGNDSTSNQNDFTANNISTSAGTGNDVLFDAPTNGTQSDTGVGGEVSGNYCTLNPLNKSDTATISNGNLSIVDNVDNDQTTGTIAVSSGKFYFETTITTYSGSQRDGLVGISEVNNTDFEEYVGKGAYSYGIGIAEYNTYMQKYNGNTAVNTDLTPPGLGDVVGVAFDLDNGKIYFHKNGTYANSGNPANGTNAAYTGLSGTFAPAITCSGSTGGTVGHDLNFGQRAFAYSAPSGFKALCTTNITTPTIADGSDHFAAIKYAGNSGDGDSTTQDITTGFEPGFVWIKDLDGGNSHHLFDTIRGSGKRLFSNNTNSESTATSTLSSFGTDKFTLNGNNAVNDTGSDYISWSWKAASSNTQLSVGSSNSAFYNQSQNWTNLYTTSSGSMQNPGGSFDGSTSTQSYILNATATWEVSTAFTVNDKVEIFFNNNSNTSFYITSDGSNWTEITGIGGATGWRTVMNSGSFKGFRTTQSDASSTSASVKAVRIDGVLLVDSGVSLSGLTQYPSNASTVRANQAAGFSIVSYVGDNTLGTSYGHGLNAVPAMIIVKNRDAGENWAVYHKNLTSANKYLSLNDTGAQAGNTGWWNDTAPTTSLFYTGNAGTTAGNNQDHIAYCFSPVEGYSAFGSYEGNGSSDGPFVYTGFRPRWIMYKWADGGGEWAIRDTARSTHNVSDQVLTADSSGAEQENAVWNVDILSNGFKIRTSSAGSNSSSTFIYAAFAENPFAANGGLAR
jgi:hypothetical protein